MPVVGSDEPNLNTTLIIGKIGGMNRVFLLCKIDEILLLRNHLKAPAVFYKPRALSINGQNFVCVWARVGGCRMNEEQPHLISFATLSSVINQGKVMGSATGEKVLSSPYAHTCTSTHTFPYHQAPAIACCVVSHCPLAGLLRYGKLHMGFI